MSTDSRGGGRNAETTELTLLNDSLLHLHLHSILVLQLQMRHEGHILLLLQLHLLR